MKKFKRSECFITKPKYQHLETDLVPHNSLSICRSTGPTPGGNSIIMEQNDTEPSEPSRTVQNRPSLRLKQPSSSCSSSGSAAAVHCRTRTRPAAAGRNNGGRSVLQVKGHHTRISRLSRHINSEPRWPGFPPPQEVSLLTSCGCSSCSSSVSMLHQQPGPIWRSEPTDSCSLMVKTRNMQRRKLLLN